MSQGVANKPGIYPKRRPNHSIETPLSEFPYQFKTYTDNWCDYTKFINIQLINPRGYGPFWILQ